MPTVPARVLRRNWRIYACQGRGHRCYRCVRRTNETLADADLYGKIVFSSPCDGFGARATKDVGSVFSGPKGLPPRIPPSLGNFPVRLSDDQETVCYQRCIIVCGIFLGDVASFSKICHRRTPEVSTTRSNAALTEVPRL